MAIRIRALTCIVLLAATACSGSSATTTQGAPTTSPPERHHHTKSAHHRRHHHRHRHRPKIVPAADLPNPRLTPGAVLTTSRAVVCRSGYASSVRDVPESEKAAVYARYGIPWVPYKHEVDHLVSLELGGSNAITNLWPEPYAGRWGARTKDVLENTLHDLVCSGAIPLPYAQHIEAMGWVRAYRRYIGRL
jgi:5-methylcytosine-specific restriction endonuclease McrA